MKTNSCMVSLTVCGKGHIKLKLLEERMHFSWRTWLKKHCLVDLSMEKFSNTTLLKVKLVSFRIIIHSHFTIFTTRVRVAHIRNWSPRRRPYASDDLLPIFMIVSRRIRFNCRIKIVSPIDQGYWFTTFLIPHKDSNIHIGATVRVL